MRPIDKDDKEELNKIIDDAIESIDASAPILPHDFGLDDASITYRMKRERKEKHDKEIIKLVEELDDAETEDGSSELITLYITPNRDIKDVIEVLKQEKGIAAHIVSEQTRKHITDALNHIIELLDKDEDKLQRWISFDAPEKRLPPEKGLAIFCGERDKHSKYYIDTHQNDIVVFRPPEPVKQSSIRIDRRFDTEHLKELMFVKC